MLESVAAFGVEQACAVQGNLDPQLVANRDLQRLAGAAADEIVTEGEHDLQLAADHLMSVHRGRQRFLAVGRKGDVAWTKADRDVPRGSAPRLCGKVVGQQ